MAFKKNDGNNFTIFIALKLFVMFSNNRNLTRWVFIFISFLIISLILWNTYAFFQIFKNEERVKMEQWAEAQKTIRNSDVNTEIELPLKIIQNASIPIMVVENDSITNAVNIDEVILNNKTAAKKFLEALKSENRPIEMEYVSGKFLYLYYGDSQLLKKLKYYPIALILIIVLFGVLVYNFYKSTKMVAENKLWAGMAKETAHQIGTPLSSLVGWLEIMKSDNIDSNMINEIEKDINRLQNITDRFSKIGSEPSLELLDIVAATKESFDYLISRFSKQIVFSFSEPKIPIMIPINAILHSWTIENLVKNAIDAMKGRGSVSIKIETDAKFVKIKISDSGKGIPKNQFKTIFEPGFTTKKRGWGLGLSLTKRIVEEYHNGKIKVLESEIGKGTTFIICYRK